MKSKRREIYLTALVLMALYLSLAESLIPKPFPWMKLGLANIATIVAIEKFDAKMGLEVFFLRVLIQGIMLGTLFTPSFIISLTSGGISTLLIILIYKFRKQLSLLAISAMGAFFHNSMQLIVVYFLLFRNISINSKSILMFVWGFLLMGCISGIVTGFIAERLNLRRGCLE
ncbi:MAG: Gx transporter family protein [Cetobacterium sp.]|uniref:Gx transporter family protein n=1 Tax=unclassified Cetobacterium TaxID=2630983 RepID=UPI00163C9B8E|nr:Gx transporter family protein [Cetobacterium sp. 2A]MBC2856384.1 Gx transporter family protein [Cetobacterium sp. 2A]